MKEMFKKKDMRAIRAVNTIAALAEKKIFQETGLRMRVLTLSAMPKSSGNTPPEEMMGVIANSLEMTLDDYRNKTRKAEFVALRQIGCMFLRDYYRDTLSLVQMGELIGDYHHSSVLHAIETGKNRLQSKDYTFTEYYNIALEAVTQFWADTKE